VLELVSRVLHSFEAMMMREDCEKGFFVTFDFTSDALHEVESFFKHSHKVIVALTVQEILDEQIAKKLVGNALPHLKCKAGFYPMAKPPWPVKVSKK
jgi:hypothetical protein